MWQLLPSPRFRAKYLAVLIGCFVLWPSIILAASDTHHVSLGITDTVAPTAPTDLSVSDAGNTIVVTWSDGTDDQAIRQYLIERDGVIVGTSSSSSFTDSNPGPGTYVYGVAAEDFGGNRSATTTASLSVASSGGGGGGSSNSRNETSARIAYGDGFVSLTVLLEDQSGIVVRYGLTPSYEIGTIVFDETTTEHVVIIENVTLNERYYYQIEDDDGDELLSDSFVVQSDSSNGSVLQSQWFSITENNNGFNLSVLNGVISAGHTLLIVHLRDRPPLHRFDGDVVYKGTDSDIKLDDSGYYTLWLESPTGEYSGGLLLTAGVAEIVTDPFGAQVQGVSWSPAITMVQGTASIGATGTVISGSPILFQFDISDRTIDGAVVSIGLLQAGVVNDPTQLVLTASTSSLLEARLPVSSDAIGPHLITVTLYQDGEVVELLSTIVTVEAAPVPTVTLELVVERIRELIRKLLIDRIRALLQGFSN